MLEISEFNAADYLEDTEDVAAFLDAAYERDGATGLSRALATVSRSQGMEAVADEPISSGDVVTAAEVYAS